MSIRRLLFFLAFSMIAFWSGYSAERKGKANSSKSEGVTLGGIIVDDATGEKIGARIYVQDAGGKYYFTETAAASGSAVRYEKRNWNNTNSVEIHTTLSADPFAASLKPGEYSVTIERGKEYFPLTRKLALGKGTKDETFRLKRWINMAERGWYSGDTHVHRELKDLPNLVQAEDLNVAFPLVYWVTKAFAPPTTGNKNLGGTIPDQLIKVDDTHVIYPRNTEYEIFTVNGKRHTLGAIFVLNHKTVLDMGAPPVAPIAERARKEGALLELDKHNWPWSMMLVPVMNVDLFELSNNHVWRTEFGFNNFGLDAPAYMKLAPIGKWSESDWLHYGFQNYYALLNCGFNLRPTAGTADGVHPVPLGFGRVYVFVRGEFTYEKWIEGLSAGRSFVTTGPMLFVRMNERLAGHRFEGAKKYRVSGSVVSEQALNRIEVIVNGRIARTIKPQSSRTEAGAFECLFETDLKIDESSWVTVRCFESRPGGRIRFAHSGVFHVNVPGKPLRPRREEVEFLVRRMDEQIERSQGVLSPEAIAEYEKAREIYRELAKNAR